MECPPAVRYLASRLNFRLFSKNILIIRYEITKFNLSLHMVSTLITNHNTFILKNVNNMKMTDNRIDCLSHKTSCIGFFLFPLATTKPTLNDFVLAFWCNLIAFVLDYPNCIGYPNFCYHFAITVCYHS